jgi:hypothetical protein
MLQTVPLYALALIAFIVNASIAGLWVGNRRFLPALGHIAICGWLSTYLSAA